jgi:lipid II:glycine glycyltransferase (peptidoglycan interpeptide bridge formation enzyme)
MIELKILEKNELKEWNKIVRESPYGTIFHTLEWMEILERTYNVKKLPIGIYQDDKMIGVFPAFLQRKAFLKLITSPLREAATPYGGPLIKENFLKEVALAFDKFTKNMSYIDITFSPKMDLNGKILRSSNYEERFTYILNLDQEIDDIWKNLNKKCRNMIRKAEKSNVKIIEGDKKEYLEEYYKMVEDTYKKSNMKPPISMKYYQMVFDVLYPKKQLKVLFAEYDGKLIAGAIFPYFEDRIYYWDGASYQEYNKVAPNNLIQWHLIEWAVKNEFKVYDMIGANIPSIAKFKASFGGDMARYFYVYKFNSVLAMYGRSAYVWWRKNIRKDLR